MANRLMSDAPHQRQTNQRPRHRPLHLGPKPVILASQSFIFHRHRPPTPLHHPLTHRTRSLQPSDFYLLLLRQNGKSLPVVVPREFIQTLQSLLFSQPSPHRTPQPHSIDQLAISHCTQTPNPQQGIDIANNSVRLRGMPPIKPRRAQKYRSQHSPPRHRSDTVLHYLVPKREIHPDKQQQWHLIDPPRMQPHHHQKRRVAHHHRHPSPPARPHIHSQPSQLRRINTQHR